MARKITAALFWGLLGIALVVWVLRGFRLLTFLPGGILWLLLLMAVVMGLIWTAYRPYQS